MGFNENFLLGGSVTLKMWKFSVIKFEKFLIYNLIDPLFYKFFRWFVYTKYWNRSLFSFRYS